MYASVPSAAATPYILPAKVVTILGTTATAAPSCRRDTSNGAAIIVPRDAYSRCPLGT